MNDIKKTQKVNVTCDSFNIKGNTETIGKTGIGYEHKMTVICNVGTWTESRIRKRALKE